MATLADITQRVRNNLYGAFPTEAPFATTIVESYTDSETTIDVAEEDNWAPQDILENLGTAEQMLVTAVTSDDSDDLTVIRGWNGTTAAASAGTGDTLLKNPRFTGKQITDAIDDTLLALEGWGVHAWGIAQITRADPAWFYELSETDILEPYGVVKVYEVESNFEIPRALPFRYERQLGTNPSEYDEGRGVTIQDWGRTVNAGVVEVIYAQQIDAVGDLLPRQEELVVLGATARLLGMTIVPATHDPGARSDRTTQPGQTSRDWGNFEGRFVSMARSESGLLAVERQKILTEVPKYARARRWSG